MGILDNLLGAAAPRASVTEEAPPAVLIDSLTELISGQGHSGGLAGLAQRFSHAGLGDVLDSWIGRGENAPVTGPQLEAVLGSDFISGLAARLGVDGPVAAALVAQWLPRLIDAFTPTGRLPEQRQFGEDPGLLSAVVGALLRR